MSAPITLALDASTYAGTVAVFRGEALAAHGEAAMRGRDEERLMPAVAATLREARLDVDALDRVVCGAGPGSFTSLRIAASIAKGICAARGLPLVAVPSLALLVAGAGPRPAGRYLATMDAMRGERYASLVTLDADGTVLEVGAVELHPAAAIAARAAALGAAVVASDERARPDARGALQVLRARGVDAAPVPLDAWEPAYGRVAEAQARWEAAHGQPLPHA